jgi:hypothetical protein
MLNSIPLKTQAHILKEYLKTKKIEIKLGYAYEAVAKMHGFENWDTCSAFYKMKQKLETKS